MISEMTTHVEFYAGEADNSEKVKGEVGGAERLHNQSDQLSPTIEGFWVDAGANALIRL